MGNALNTARHAIWNDTMKGVIKKVEETVALADFTDGTSTSGTYTFTAKIPAASLVLGTKAVVTTGFTSASDTSTCVMTVGDGSTADLWGVTMVVKTAATVGCAAKYASNVAVPFCATATAPVLTVTEDSDFTSLTSGLMTVSVYYIELN